MLRQSAWAARAARRRPWTAAWLAAAALAALAATARLLAPPELSAVAEFPRVAPAHLAHLLADVSAHTLTVPGSWTLEDEAGNYTSWRYTVAYACGPRCEGRARVLAVELAARGPWGQGGPQGQGGPRHGLGDAHRVTVARRHCQRLPWLPWPQLWEETETESVVSSVGPDGAGGVGGEGARLQQTLRARCGVAAALLARCSSARDLRAARDALLLALRDKLHNRDHRLVR